MHRRLTTKPKVLFLITKFYRGGAETLVYNLAPRLATEYEVLVAALYLSDDRSGDESLLRQNLERAGVKTAVCGKRIGRGQIRAITCLVRLMRDFAPDVLNSHCFLPNLYGQVSARLAGTKVRVATHHSGSIEWTGRSYWVAKALLPLITLHLAVSEQVVHNLVNVLGVRPGQIRIIPNGVDVSKFAKARSRRAQVRQALALSPGDIALVNVGNIYEAKGQEYLIRALPYLIDTYPTIRAFIAGSVVDDGVAARLRTLIHELGVADHIQLLGGREDVPGLLAAGDVFVMPSVVEAHPVALLEAMATGIPCVGSDVPGICSVVRADEDAVLVPPRNPRALADGIWRVVRDDEFARQLCNSARKKVEQEYDINQTVAAYSALFSEFLGAVKK